ncbi:unnamed protein product, partial [Staurois parvus]
PRPLPGGCPAVSAELTRCPLFRQLLLTRCPQSCQTTRCPTVCLGLGARRFVWGLETCPLQPGGPGARPCFRLGPETFPPPHRSGGPRPVAPPGGPAPAAPL